MTTLAAWADSRTDDHTGSKEAFVRFLAFLGANRHRADEDRPDEAWDAELAKWEPPA